MKKFRITAIPKKLEGGPPVNYSGPRNYNSLLDDAYSKFPGLEVMKDDLEILGDTDFNREKTGIGDIEFFGADQDVITYPNGFKYENPNPGGYGIPFNPKTNNTQSIALDMLHGMDEADSKYKKLKKKFGDAFLSSKFKDDFDKELKYIKEEVGDEKIYNEEYGKDGLKYFDHSYLDGVIRNLLYEGTPEDFKKDRYWDKAQEVYLSDPKLKETFGNLKEHLTTKKVTPDKYVKDALTLKKGGVIKIPKKRSGGQYNRRVLNDLDRFLMDPYSSKKYSKSLAATNSVFAVNDLFKKPARSRIYNPNAKYFKHGGTPDPILPPEYLRSQGFVDAANEDLNAILGGFNADGYDSHYYTGKVLDQGATDQQLRKFSSEYHPKSFLNAAAYAKAMNELAVDAGGKNVSNIPFADNPMVMRTSDDDIEYKEYYTPRTIVQERKFDPKTLNAIEPQVWSGEGGMKEGGELPKAMLGKALRNFARNFDNTSIGFQPYSKLNPTAKSWTPKLTFNTVMGSPKKGFLDTAIEAGGDKEGFTGGLNARYFSPYMNSTGRGVKFDARIDGDAFYDKGYTGLNLSAGPNFHFGSKPNRELKRGRARFDVQPFNLRIGAGWDPQSITNQSYDGSNVLSNTTAGTSAASENIDFEPSKSNFEMDWGYGASARGEWKPNAKWFPGTVFGEAAYNADLLGRNTGSISQETGNTYSYESGVNQETGINDGTGTVTASEIENTFKPQHKFNVKLGLRVPLDDIKFNRRRGRTPDELDQDISVKERKPKPEKEPKPKKEPKPIEVNEWARHPRWLQDGGELPKHNFLGIAGKVAKGSKKNPLMNKLSRYMDGINRGANEILSNPLSSRKFSEIFPITQAQKIASDNLQREAMHKGDDFVKQWVYGNGPHPSQTDMPKVPRAGVEQKIQDIFLSLDQPSTGPTPGPYAGLDLRQFHDNFLIHHGYPKRKKYGWNSLTYNKDNPFVAQGSPHLIGSEIFNSKRAQDYIPKIGNYGVNYLQDNYDNIGGVNLNTGPSITLKDRGLYRISPADLEEVGAHEAGHTFQKLGYYINSSQEPMRWDQVIERWNPDLKTSSGKKQGYYEGNPDTALGKRFKDAMVEGKYWESSPSELHSELMVSRMNAFNAMKKDPAYANFSNDQIMEIMQLDEPEMLKYIYDTPSGYGKPLSRFFKKETPLQERLDLIKLLPGLAAPFVLPGLMDDNKPKLQDGGELPKHNWKGIVKGSKNLANEIAIGNTWLPGWKSPVSPTLHHNELLQNLGKKGVFSQIENINQTDLSTLAETLLTDYATNSGPYKMRAHTEGTIGDGTVNWAEPNPSAPWKTPQVFDPERKKLFQEQIQDKFREINIPEETLFTRVVDRNDSNLLNIDNGVIRVGDNLNSFTVGPASNIISGGANTDRFVLTGKNTKGYENNFLKNTYPIVTSEHSEMAKESLFPIVNQGFNSGSIEEVNRIMNQLKKEREAIFTGADLKIKYKVKNDRGGFDYIVRPVPLGYTTPQYEQYLKNTYLRKGLGIGAGSLLLGSDDDDKKKIGGVIKIRKSKLNKFKH